jgi:CheY-like chemotaxis protein
MSSTTASNRKIRILAVDDEPDILLTLNAVLEGLGHYVTTLITQQKLWRILQVVVIIMELHRTMTWSLLIIECLVVAYQD